MIEATPSLSFSEAINAAANKIFRFQGRSRRSEFWWTQLLVYIVSFFLTPIVGGLLDLLTIPLTFRRLHDTGRSGWWWGIGALLKFSFIILLGYDFITTIIGTCGMKEYGYEFIIALLLKYLLFSIGIFIYQIILLVFCCLDSEPFENDYGASPKYIDDTETDI